MGITIHYSGTLKDQSKIDKLIDELIDISEIMKWKYNIIKPDSSKDDTIPPLYGIMIGLHDRCESVSFIFDKKGRIHSKFALMFYDESDKYQLTESVKTQFSSPDVHICIINLLRYIKKVYIKNLKVYDEGEYWESSDRDRLFILMEFLNRAINAMRNMFEANKTLLEESQSKKTLTDKLTELMKKHFGAELYIKQINAPVQRNKIRKN